MAGVIVVVSMAVVGVVELLLSVVTADVVAAASVCVTEGNTLSANCTVLCVGVVIEGVLSLLLVLLVEASVSVGNVGVKLGVCVGV